MEDNNLHKNCIELYYFKKLRFSKLNKQDLEREKEAEIRSPPSNKHLFLIIRSRT